MKTSIIKKAVPVLAGVAPVYLTVELMNGRKGSLPTNSSIILKDLPDVDVVPIELPSGGGGSSGIQIPGISSGGSSGSRGASSSSSRGSSISSSQTDKGSQSPQSSTDTSQQSQSDTSQSQGGSTSSGPSSKGGGGGASGGGSGGSSKDGRTPEEQLSSLIKGLIGGSDRLKNNTGSLSVTYELATKTKLLIGLVNSIKANKAGTGAGSSGPSD